MVSKEDRLIPEQIAILVFIGFEYGGRISVTMNYGTGNRKAVKDFTIW